MALWHEFQVSRVVYVRLQVFVVLVTDFLGRYEKVGFRSLPNLLDKVKKTAKRHAGYLPWEGHTEGQQALRRASVLQEATFLVLG